MSNEFDEETWLVEPPKTDSATQSSGHIIEWLQGATTNLDYRTRTALSRTLATQAARRKTRSNEKVRPSRLNSLAECAEPPVSNAAQYQAKPVKLIRSPRTTIDTAAVDGTEVKRSPRQLSVANNTSNFMNKSVSNSPRDGQMLDKGSLPQVSKALSLTNPDLRDIEQIAEMQETALREELMLLQRKSSSHSDGTNSAAHTRQPTGPPSAHSTKSNPAMSSSRSADFFADSSGPPSAPQLTTHVSRLPTPLRRPGGGMRSMIPMRTSRISAPKTAVRGLAGGSTPSLAPPDSRRSTNDETKSECGPNEWADECF